MIAAYADAVEVREYDLGQEAIFPITPDREHMISPDYEYRLEILSRGATWLIVATKRREILPSRSSQLQIDSPRVILGTSASNEPALFSCVILSSGKNEKLNLLLSIKPPKRL